MGLRNTTTEWGTPTKALHWIIAIAIFALLYLGLEQAGMESGDEKSRIRFIHASIATVLLGLMTVRIIWRFMNEVPAHPDGMAPVQRLVATLVVLHILGALYNHFVLKNDVVRRMTHGVK